MRLHLLLAGVFLAGWTGSLPAQDATVPKEDFVVTEPLTATERAATVELTRQRATRLWWNKKNRVIAISFKGDDANDRSLALAGRLPGLRSLVLVATPDDQLTDNGLAAISRLPNLQLLSIAGNRVTDAGMIHIGQLAGLRTLVLNCNVTDSGLETLSTLPNLEQLDLTQTQVTDAGIASLRNFPKLQTLILNGTDITNAGLPVLVELKALQQLYLGNTAIDDQAVDTLKQLEQLTLLFVSNSQMTSAAVQELQPFFSAEACKIIHQSGKYPGTRKTPLAMASVPSSQWYPAK